jgi:hypothetical protein
VTGILLLLWVALWIAGFVDALTSDATRVRLMPKVVWVILILLFGGLGAIAWFFLGHPRGAAQPGTRTLGGFNRFGPPAGSSGHPSMFGRTESPKRGANVDDPAGGWQLGGARRTGPLAPDDDPDFLRQISKRRADGAGGSTGSGDGLPDQPA